MILKLTERARRQQQPIQKLFILIYFSKRKLAQTSFINSTINFHSKLTFNRFADRRSTVIVNKKHLTKINVFSKNNCFYSINMID